MRNQIGGATAMSVKITPLSPAIGAEIHGVDLSKPVSADVQQILLRAWHENVLILFRNQNISDDELLSSSDWIGPLGARSRPTDRRQEPDPYIMLVSNRDR